jgi:hypothetical protein
MPKSALLALLDEPRLVHDQHPARTPQMPGHQAAYVIAHRVRIPHRLPQQSLHRRRTGQTCMLSQLPAVLPLHPRQQAEHEQPGGTPRLNPPKTTGDLRHDLVEQRAPTTRPYDMAHGHREIFSRLHKHRMIARWPSHAQSRHPPTATAPSQARTRTVTAVLVVWCQNTRQAYMRWSPSQLSGAGNRSKVTDRTWALTSLRDRDDAFALSRRPSLGLTRSCSWRSKRRGA